MASAIASLLRTDKQPVFSTHYAAGRHRKHDTALSARTVVRSGIIARPVRGECESV